MTTTTPNLPALLDRILNSYPLQRLPLYIHNLARRIGSGSLELDGSYHVSLVKPVLARPVEVSRLSCHHANLFLSHNMSLVFGLDLKK